MESKIKLVLALSLFLLTVGVLLIGQNLKSGQARLVFCDIGQGDGFLVISRSGKQVLVDSGPGSRILDCLGKNMPFWDRKIEVMIPTHQQKDHFEGQVAVFENYQVENVVWTGYEADSNLFGEWMIALKAEKSKTHIAKAGETILADDLTFKILWPTVAFARSWEVKGVKDVNETSIVMKLTFGSGECAYLTGDAPVVILESVLKPGCDILKVAHHGSKTGTTSELVAKIKPKIAVIQVGKKNQYGHPHKEVLDYLSGVNIFRNDVVGEIEIGEYLTSDK